jgi:hypothetical protein
VPALLGDVLEQHDRPSRTSLRVQRRRGQHLQQHVAAAHPNEHIRAPNRFPGQRSQRRQVLARQRDARGGSGAQQQRVEQMPAVASISPVAAQA